MCLAFCGLFQLFGIDTRFDRFEGIEITEGSVIVQCILVFLSPFDADDLRDVTDTILSITSHGLDSFIGIDLIRLTLGDETGTN